MIFLESPLARNTERLKEEINEVVEKVGIKETERVKIIFVLTGGTSKKIKEILKTCDFAFLIAHNKMNSLPSALGAKNERTFVYIFRNKEELEKILIEIKKLIEVYEYIKNAKVLVIGEEI